MSMYRQFWLAIINSMLLAFIGSVAASMLSARAYLQEQLTMKNADNASALALSLSQSNPDRVAIELTVSALFDSGHYELIRVVDPDGVTMVERFSGPVELEAPRWFADLLPILAQPGQAQISNGWAQVGTLTLLSHSRFAYGALWKSVWRMVGALALAGVVGGCLGSIILARLRAPLQAVIEQAMAISDRRFMIIDEPRVPELRHLAGAMNMTVGRLKKMFEDEAARIEALRRAANVDALTGLANRDHFMARLRQLLEGEDAGEGCLLLIRLADLGEINRRLGRVKTDDYLRRIGEQLAACANQDPPAFAGRLNGADFALLLSPGSDGRARAASLLQALNDCGRRAGGDDAAVWIGLGRFDHESDLPNLLARVDGALAAAEASRRSAIRELPSDEPRDAQHGTGQWSAMITRALAQQWLRLVLFPVVDAAGRLSHYECPLRMLSDEGGQWLPAGRFLPMAERLRLTPALDLAALRLGLNELASRSELPGLAVNLSARSVVDAGFRQQLLTLVADCPSESRRLWLEVDENGAFSELPAFREFRLALLKTGCRVGLEHFGHRFSEVGLLHDLGLDYLKVDASFVRDVHHNRGNAAFLEGLASVAHDIGLQVIAEGVTTHEELSAVIRLGFDGVTGPAVSEPSAGG